MSWNNGCVWETCSTRVPGVIYQLWTAQSQACELFSVFWGFPVSTQSPDLTLISKDLSSQVWAVFLWPWSSSWAPDTHFFTPWHYARGQGPRAFWLFLPTLCSVFSWYLLLLSSLLFFYCPSTPPFSLSAVPLCAERAPVCGLVVLVTWDAPVTLSFFTSIARGWKKMPPKSCVSSHFLTFLLTLLLPQPGFSGTFAQTPAVAGGRGRLRQPKVSRHVHDLQWHLVSYVFPVSFCKMSCGSWGWCLWEFSQYL